MGFFKDMGTFVSAFSDAVKSTGQEDEAWVKMLPILLKLEKMDKDGKLSAKTKKALHAYFRAEEEELILRDYATYAKEFEDAALSKKLDQEWDKAGDVRREKYDAFLKVLDEDTTLSAAFQKEIDEATDLAQAASAADRAVREKVTGIGK